MEGLAALVDYLNARPGIGDALVSAFGTIVAALLATLTGVWTYVLARRHDARRTREDRLREIEREEALRQAERERADLQRTERINDIVRGLHAEILTGIVLYEDQERTEAVRHAVFDLTPFATPDETDFVFDVVTPDLSILPSTLIHRVVAYYRVARQTNMMIRDFRDPLFLGQKPEDKQRFMEGYVALVFVLKRRGEEAVAALAEYAATQGIDLTAAGLQIRESTQAAMAAATAAITVARRLGPERSDNGADRA